LVGEGFFIFTEVITQVEKIIKLDNVDLLSLLGFNDTNLKPIESRFNTVISVRGDNVYLKGVADEITTVEKILKEMVYVLNTTGKLESNDVSTIIDLTVQVINEVHKFFCLASPDLAKRDRPLRYLFATAPCGPILSA